MTAVACDYCGEPAELVTGADIYRRRADLSGLRFWRCVPCDAHVGCHKPESGFGDGTRPLGRLANAELRRAKSEAHAAFHPLWKTKRMSRADAYAWLAGQLGLKPVDSHIGMFDVERCRAVVRAVEERSSVSLNSGPFQPDEALRALMSAGSIE